MAEAYATRFDSVEQESTAFAAELQLDSSEAAPRARDRGSRPARRIHWTYSPADAEPGTPSRAEAGRKAYKPARGGPCAPAPISPARPCHRASETRSSAAEGQDSGPSRSREQCCGYCD